MSNAKGEDIGFVISFIQEVESRQCLWNYSLQSYSKCDETSLAWKEIAEKLKDTESNCRERWKNIRCAFVRSLRPPKSGSGIKGKKKYYLADYLSFLLPYLKRSATSGNLSVPAAQDKCEEDIPPSIHSSELQDENDDHNSSHATSFENPSEHIPSNELHSDKQIPPHSQKPTIKRANLTTALDRPTAFVEWLNSKKCNPHSKERDADLLFFESLVPDVKQLDNKRKRRFKADVLHLLNNALEECERQTPTPCTSLSSNTEDCHNNWAFQQPTHQPIKGPVNAAEDSTQDTFAILYL